ncbi:MAG: tetratricopeptide repeat protein [Dolichospermum sp.]
MQYKHTVIKTNHLLGKIVMKNKKPILSNIALKRTIFFSPLLLLTAFISQSIVPSATAQVLSNQHQEKLAQKPVKSDLEIAFTRTNTLINIWLTILSLFPVALIAVLWFFRRAIIREIVERGMQQIQGIENLQTQLTTVQIEAKNLIRESQNTTQELAQEVDNFKHKIQGEQENLSMLLSDLPKSKQEFLTALEIEVKSAQENISNLEFTLNTQLERLNLSAQQQKITIDNIKKLETELLSEFIKLKLEVENQKDIAIVDIEQSRSNLISQFNLVESEAQAQKYQTFENLVKLQVEFTGELSQFQLDVKNQKDIVINNIENLNNLFKSEVTELKTDTQIQKYQFIEDLSRSQGEFSQQLTELQNAAIQRKQQIIEDLEKSGEEFTSQFSDLQNDVQKQQITILENLQKLEIDAQQRKDIILKELAEITPPPVIEKAPEPLQPETSLNDYLKEAEKLFLEKRHQDALAIYEQIIKIQPENPENWLKRGILFNRLNRYKDAIMSYNQAIKINPEYHQAWCDIGVSCGKLGKHQEAFNCFDKAIQIKPDDGVAWVNRGLSLVELERYEDAITSFDKALEFQPNSPKIWHKRGYTLVRLGEDDQAIISFDKALEIKPDYHIVYYHKAACYALQRQVKLALENLQKAIEFNPNYREEAGNDIDFDALKNEPDFQKLIQG